MAEFFIEEREVELENGEKKRVTFDGWKPKMSTAALVSFDISFDDEDHHVRGIKAGVKILNRIDDWVEVEGIAEAWDDDANHAYGTVRAVVIAEIAS